MNTLDVLWYFVCPQRTQTHLRATLSKFDNCSSPSQKNGKWSDALEAMAVGPDLPPTQSMRVHQRCQMNSLDELWYFDCPQRTQTNLRTILFRFDKCSSPSQKNGKWPDVLEAMAGGHDPATPHIQLECINIVQRKHWMNYDILIVLRGPKLTSGRPFPGLTNAAPPPRKWEMIRCTWGYACRTWSNPHTSNECASTWSDKYIGWIMIFWLSLEDPNSPRNDPFQIWQMQSPLPEKWEMIRCAWGYGCRTWLAPQTSNENASRLSEK